MTVPDWLTWAADLGSLVGLAVTLSVWLQTRAIRRSFVLRARIPEIAKALKSISSDLVKSLQNSPVGVPYSDAAIARLNALLANLSPKVEGGERKMVRGLLKKSKGTQNWSWVVFWRSGKASLTTDQAWEVYRETQGLLEALIQASKDSKWG